MKPKQITALALIAFVSVSVGYMIAKETKAPLAENETASTVDVNPTVNSQTSDTNDFQFIVYYFHGDVRCLTCHKLEAYAKETLDTYFSDELAEGKIVWKPVNVDEPQNRHFIQDYKLVTKSVVLSKVRQGKEFAWQNLDRIWQEVRNKQNYLEYVRDSILKFMEDTKS